MMFFVYFVLVLIGIPFLFYLIRHWRQSRKTPRQYYVCLDGHRVRSRGEWMIDAVLQYLGIPHEYEPRLQVKRQVIHPDFGLGHGIFIEYWGLQTRNYLRHKKLKQLLYKTGKHHLINIENVDLRNLLHVLTQSLEQYEEHFPQFHNILKISGYKFFSGGEAVASAN